MFQHCLKYVKMHSCLRSMPFLVQSLVPLGSVEQLLVTYDTLRRGLPAPVAMGEWGWTKSVETWNGRAALVTVVTLLILEVTSGEGVLHQLGILPLFH